MARHFLSEHQELTRRYFMNLGAAGATAWAMLPDFLRAEGKPREAALEKAVNELEFLTKPKDFRDVSRGKPVPHSLPAEKKAEVGLTAETWKLEVRSDPEHPSKLRRSFTKKDGNAFDWKQLMKLAKTNSVSFPKVMTCNNIGCPLGMGIWEGVPLRDVIWKVEPRRDVRRVFFYGYHNNDPKQMFRSSLPIGRVLEDPFGLPPVILCYKLNGKLLTPKRGAPVRVVVPEAYGFKSIKWLTNVVLTNLHHANDTYANGNNDLDSFLKSFAATISINTQVKKGQATPVTGYAQVGISGVSKVQYWVHPAGKKLTPGDRYFTKAPWRDAEILGPPSNWGGSLPNNRVPAETMGFDGKTGKPKHWPMRLAHAHWAVLLPGMPAGQYDFRCRTVDENGVAQPMPRPFDKSGRNSIERIRITVDS